MPSRSFGQFLLERGAISREGLLDAAAHQKGIIKPLCALAIEANCFDDSNLAHLHAASSETGKLPVEIALRDKILTFQKVQELSKAPVENRHTVAEAIIRRGHMNLAEYREHLQVYLDSEAADQQKISEVRELLADMPHADVIAPFLEVTMETFLTYTRQIVEITSAEFAKHSSQEIAYVFSQRVTGDEHFEYALVLPEDFVLAIASYMYNEEMTEITAVVLDASAEFVNVVVGNGCTRLGMKNATTTADPPRVAMKEAIDSGLFSGDSVSVTLRTAKDYFKILFSFLGKEPM